MPESKSEFDYPDVSDVLRERLVDELIANGMSAGDAEVVADETVAFAHARAEELRARRTATPPEGSTE